MMAITSACGQSKSGAGYYADKWNVLVKGTPNGDARMYFLLAEEGGKLKGSVQDSTGKEMSKMDSTVVAGEELTVYFIAGGYNVYVNLKKKDEDHAEGNLMGMFETYADRVKGGK